MSITTSEPQAKALPRPTVDAGTVTLPHVVASEWLKFRTLRSSWVVLVAAVLAMLVLSMVIGYNTGKHFSGLAPEDAAASGPLQGYYLAQLLIGVLGVLFVSGEYSTGMIRSTLAAVPRRVPVLLAKSAVFATIAAVTMVASSFGAFFASQLFLSHYGHGSALSDPGVLRAVVGTGVYLALIGLMGGAFGWIVRSTPGGISSLVGVLLVIPVLLEVLPGSWATTLSSYFPAEAGSSFVMSVQLPDTLGPWTGLLVLVAWVVGLLSIATVLLKNRDA